MFISGIPHRTDWADALIAEYAPGWRCTFYLPKTPGKVRNGVRGHARVNSRHIEIMVSRLDRTAQNLWIVLHEIAHAVHEIRRPGYYRTHKSKHPPEFWRIALSLYRRHPEVLEHAATHEYIVGRKYIVKHTGDAKGAALLQERRERNRKHREANKWFAKWRAIPREDRESMGNDFDEWKAQQLYKPFMRSTLRRRLAVG
jgi:hypothetical protein